MMQDIAQMKSLSAVMAQLKEEGFTEEFKVDKDCLVTQDGSQRFPAQDINILNYYRFEGESDPNYMDILYAIETKNGIKGVLTDAYGPDAEPSASEFLLHVRNMHKKHAY